MQVAEGAPERRVVYGASTTVSLDEVLVLLDLADNVAQIACDDGHSIHWRELPRSEAELLVRLGAKAQVQLPVNGGSEKGEAASAVGSDGGLT